MVVKAIRMAKSSKVIAINVLARVVIGHVQNTIVQPLVQRMAIHILQHMMAKIMISKVRAVMFCQRVLLRRAMVSLLPFKM